MDGSNHEGRKRVPEHSAMQNSTDLSETRTVRQPIKSLGFSVLVLQLPQLPVSSATSFKAIELKLTFPLR